MASALLDRGWGKAQQPHAGADGDGDIRVTIRQIVDGRGNGRVEKTRSSLVKA